MFDVVPLGGDESPAPRTEPGVEATQVWELLAMQTRLRETAERQRAEALGELALLGEALCAPAWDEETRAGRDPARWTARQIREFIVAQVQPLIRLAARAAGDPAEEQLRRARKRIADLEREAQALREQLRMAGQESRAREAVPEDGPSDGMGPVGEANASPDAAPNPSGSSSDVSDPGRMDALVKLIASTGLCRSKVLRARLATAWGLEGDASSLDRLIIQSVRAGLVKAHTVPRSWDGSTQARLLELTEAGKARAVGLGQDPVESELTPGLRRHGSAAKFDLVMEVAEILAGAGFQDVETPLGPEAAGESAFRPDVLARQEGRLIFVLCEIDADAPERAEQWLRAAQAGEGVLHLAANSRADLERFVSQANALKVARRADYRVKGFSVEEYRKGARGRGDSLWTYQH